MQYTGDPWPATLDALAAAIDNRTTDTAAWCVRYIHQPLNGSTF